MVSMNRLTTEKRAQILHLLCEGSSIRAITRVTGVSKNTVAKLLADAGRACSEYQDRAFRNLKCRRVQVDEIWSFVYAKQAHVPKAKAAPDNAGDVWTWTAIDADTKLVPSWLVGSRDGDAAKTFIGDLAARLANKVQLTSDGHKPYLEAVEQAFGADIDYAMLQKIYGNVGRRPAAATARRSASAARSRVIEGAPRSAAHLDQLRRASEPHDAHAHAPVHATDQRLLEEGREPRACGRAALHVLQLLHAPQSASPDPCDGGWREQSPMGDCGYRRAGRCCG